MPTSNLELTAPHGTSMVSFQQLTGNRRLLELNDHAAPHGRPRHGEVLAEELRVAHSETYYPGNPVPTRHLDEIRYEPMELEGRFSDHWGGLGFAKSKTEECKRFVAERQECVLNWGDLVHMWCFIERFRAGRESRGEVAWQMTVLVDFDYQTYRVSQRPAYRSPTDYTDRIEQLLFDVDEIPRIPENLRGDIFDSLSSFVAGVSSATASVVRIADQIDDFATAPIALLQRFRAALGQLRTAVIRLRTTYDSITTDAALEFQRAGEMQQWFRSQASYTATATQTLKTIAEADRDAVLAERGRYKALHMARADETWESISRQHYGTPDRAGDIRQANGVDAGQAPVAGTMYRIPA